MIKSKLRTIERKRATLALGRPQLLPLVRDGIAARGVLGPLVGGPDSYLGRTKKGGWTEVHFTVTREALVSARYRDWLYARDEAARKAA